MTPLNVADVNSAFYHTGNGRRMDSRIAKTDRKPPPLDREFFWWDGEGGRSEVRGQPQEFILFGYVSATSSGYVQSSSLRTKECLDFILEIGEKHPHAWHVAFAFDYDVNMIMHRLPQWVFEKMRKHERKSVSITLDNQRYRLQHYPGKWFRVTRYGPNYSEHNKRDKTTVKIEDVFGFFQSSFAHAVKKYLGYDADIMGEFERMALGKSKRAEFTYAEIEFIADYWLREGKMGVRLIEELRKACYHPDVNLNITNWYGPGVLANYLFRNRGIKAHLNPPPTDVYDKARYAYAGGRFELFNIGRFTHVYGFDINSAYPAAFARLPSLTEGKWIFNPNPDPDNLQEFGLYHVRLRGNIGNGRPSPVFHRDSLSNISYPWVTEGWYWAPEVIWLRNHPDAEIVEGWEYVGWSTRPFSWVSQLYQQRRRMKENGDGAEWAIKLALNSMYGKTAQRVGYDAKTLQPPTWHQLEYAGWITAHTRSKLYSLMRRIPQDKLIAVETDGIYTTMTPDELGVQNSTELGGWEVTPLDEIVYLQSGLYAKRTGDKWTHKFRGLDATTISPERIVEHTKLLRAGEEWPALSGRETRFTKYQYAMMFPGPMVYRHCRWVTHDKDIAIGAIGKRRHIASLCPACEAGATAYEMPHRLSIISRAYSRREEIHSRKHAIPWLTTTQDETAEDWHDFPEALYDG